MSENLKKISQAISALSGDAKNSTSMTGDLANTIAKRARVSRATLYRHLEKYSNLRTSYESLKRCTQRVSRASTVKAANSDEVPEVINNLKKEISALKEERDEISRTKNAQILLLWNECKRLRQLHDDSSGDHSGNIIRLKGGQ
jgi:methyl-accepting chemotaxis protein